MVKQSVSFSREFSLLSIFQQIIAILIGVLFFLGLIPFNYPEVSGILITLIVVQLFVSLFRLHLFAFFYELILLLLSVLSFIPILGYLFRFLGFIGALFDMLFHRNAQIIKEVNFAKSSSGKKSRKNDSQKHFEGKVYEAKYKEKK